MKVFKSKDYFKSLPLQLEVRLRQLDEARSSIGRLSHIGNPTVDETLKKLDTRLAAIRDLLKDKPPRIDGSYVTQAEWLLSNSKSWITIEMLMVIADAFSHAAIKQSTVESYEAPVKFWPGKDGAFKCNDCGRVFTLIVDEPGGKK